jgi:hypothetical protein
MRKKRTRKRLILLCVTSLLLCTTSASAQEIGGVVTSVTGVWLLDGSKVVPSQQVRVGAVIKAKEPNAKYARVTVMLLDFTELSSICDREGKCPEPLRVPNAVKRRTEPPSFAEQHGLSFWQRFVRAINRSKEPKFKKTLTRSGGELSDEVVRLDDFGIDLQPIFKVASPGEFLINVRRPGDANALSSSWLVERHPVEWTGKGSVFLRSNLSPGLYILNFPPRSEESSILLPDIWILAVESSKYQELSDEYRRAAAVISRWERRSILPDDFLRAFLADLLNDRQP